MALFFQRPKEIAKIWSDSLAWASMALEKNDPRGESVGNASRFFCDVKNFLSFTEVSGKARKFAVELGECRKNPSFQKASSVFCGALTDLIVPVCDTVNLADKFLPIPPQVLGVVKVANFGATLVRTGCCAASEAREIYANRDESVREKILHAINVMSSVSYVALSVIGLASLVPAVGFAAAPWMLLACTTSGLLFGIGGFFYENLALKSEREVKRVREEEELQRKAEPEALQLAELEALRRMEALFHSLYGPPPKGQKKEEEPEEEIVTDIEEMWGRHVEQGRVVLPGSATDSDEDFTADSDEDLEEYCREMSKLLLGSANPHVEQRPAVLPGSAADSDEDAEEY